MDKKILGVSHPIPTEFARRIYEERKTVFVAKSYLGRVSKGDKFVIYESHGAKAYTGWAEINLIDRLTPKEILARFKDKLIVSEEEFKEYSEGRKEMTVIELVNFQKFNNPVLPKRFVSISGKYIYEDEFKTIKNQKGWWLIELTNKCLKEWAAAIEALDQGKQTILIRNYKIIKY